MPLIRYEEIASITYPVTDIARSRKFYQEVLGLKPTKLTEGVPFVEYNIGPGTLAIGMSEKWPPSRDGATAALEVSDFEEAVAHLKEKGVAFELGTVETPICHIVILRDPDGAKIMIHKRKSGNN